MEAYHVLVPYADPKTKHAASVHSGYRYCITLAAKPSGEVLLFEPALLATYTVPPAHLRPPTAYPKPIRPAVLAKMIRRQLKAAVRYKLGANRTAARQALALLEELSS